MNDNDQIQEHLRFFAETGVSGVSRDAAWRRRGGAGAGSGPVAPTDLAAGAPAAAGAADAGGDTADTLEAIWHDVGPDCARCKLHTLGRSQVVFGVGSPVADLMFIGEAPGRDEDIQGIPFVGRAGQLLTRIIEAINLKREDVYIANVIKCRPPGNRNPEADEIDACEPFLLRQVRTIRPKVIVALGTFAAQTLLRTNDPITRLRGRVYAYGDARLVPTFHPAYLLRSPERKREVWEDMQKVRDMLAETGPPAV